MTIAELYDLVDATIISGGRLTIAASERILLKKIIDAAKEGGSKVYEGVAAPGNSENLSLEYSKFSLGITNAGDIYICVASTNISATWKKISTEITANNGLTASGLNVELGGGLIKDTKIFGNHKVEFGDEVGGDVKSFEVTAKKIVGTNKFPSFNYGGSGTDNGGDSVGIQSDGKIIYAGSFTTYNGANVPNRLIRLLPNGLHDSTFNTGGSGIGGVIRKILVLPDNKILIGGHFNTTGYNGGTTPNRLIRILANGLHDSTFNTGGAGANSYILAMSIQSTNNIIFGGNTTSYNGNGVGRIFRTTYDGAFDNTFVSGSGFNTNVNSILVLPDNSLIVGGDFTTYNGTACNRIVKLLPNGAIDTTFVIGTGFNQQVWDIKRLSNGNIAIGGDFTTYKGSTSSKIIVVSPLGAIVTSFVVAGFNTTVLSITVQSDNKLLCSGYFCEYGTDVSKSFARLNTNGSLDTSFNVNSGPNNFTTSSILLPDGKILITGGSTTYDGITIPYGLTKLTANGSLDFQINKIFLDGYGALRGLEDYSSQYVSNSYVQKVYVDTINIPNDYNATNDPTINTDGLSGWKQGSEIATSNKLWKCKSASTGAAVWWLIYPQSGGATPQGVGSGAVGSTFIVG